MTRLAVVLALSATLSGCGHCYDHPDTPRCAFPVERHR